MIVPMMMTKMLMVKLMMSRGMLRVTKDKGANDDESRVMIPGEWG